MVIEKQHDGDFKSQAHIKGLKELGRFMAVIKIWRECDHSSQCVKCYYLRELGLYIYGIHWDNTQTKLKMEISSQYIE